MFPPDTGVAVLTGDIQTDNDAKRLAKYGFPVRQITAGGSCHLDAWMVKRQLEGWDLEALDYLLIENVGNLVCPSSYDLGEHDKIVILSVTEEKISHSSIPELFAGGAGNFGTVHAGSKLTVCSTRAGADSSGPQLGHRRVGFNRTRPLFWVQLGEITLFPTYCRPQLRR